MPLARWFAALVVAAAGCLQSPPDSQPPDGPADAASVRDSGEGFIDGAATCPELEPPGGQCALACTNDCVGDICTVDCTAGPGCHDVIVCAPGFDCDVDCGVEDICIDATVNCPAFHECVIRCGGDDSCMNMVVNCSDGPCTVFCDGDPQSCRQMVVNCGSGPCTSECSVEQTAPPTVHCEASCGCVEC